MSQRPVSSRTTRDCNGGALHKSGSLVDVSRAAGVSIATASRVLNGSTHPVSDAMRARVVEAAEQVGYTPSELARALATKQSRIIGVVVGDISDPYFGEIARGVEDAAASAGYMTIVCNADRRTETEIEQLRLLAQYRAAGVVFAGSGRLRDPHAAKLADAVSHAREDGTRIVALAVRNFEAPQIRGDNCEAARELTEYLISLGHRRIAFITGPPSLISSRDRLKGFGAAMRAAGLDRDLVYEGDFGYDGGHRVMEQLIAAGELPDAVIGANDATAIGALGALRKAHIAVPETVSVAGMTDTRPARFSDITTVRLPIYELGVAAAGRIVGTDEDDARDVVLPHEVIPRSTTARRGADSA